jgi:hypothetical protein
MLEKVSGGGKSKTMDIKTPKFRRCQLCHKSFLKSATSTMYIHASDHINENSRRDFWGRIKCPICKAAFDNPTAASTHFRRQHITY